MNSAPFAEFSALCASRSAENSTPVVQQSFFPRSLVNGKLVSTSCRSGRISTRAAGRSAQTAVRTALRHLRNSAELFCHFAEFRVVKLRELCPGLIIMPYMAACHGVNLTRIVGKPVNFKFGSWLDSRASVAVMAYVTVMLREAPPPGSPPSPTLYMRQWEGRSTQVEQLPFYGGCIVTIHLQIRPLAGRVKQRKCTFKSTSNTFLIQSCKEQST